MINQKPRRFSAHSALNFTCLTRSKAIYTFISLLIVLLLVTACEKVNIFEPDSSDDTNENAQNDFEILSVNVTGGFAGVYQELHLYADGRAELVTTFEKQQKRMELQPEEVAAVVHTFEKNHFFDLNPNYQSTEVMDAFFYQISYSDGTRAKTVTTNGFDIPENLQAILEFLHGLIEKLSRSGLELYLTADKDSLNPGDKVKMTFQVRNSTSEPLALDFTSSKVFELVAYDQFPPGAGAPVWSNNHDMAFLPVLNRTTLEPGARQDYIVEWDGTGNDGKRLKGLVYLVAELLSTPGGRTAPVKLFIR